MFFDRQNDSILEVKFKVPFRDLWTDGDVIRNMFTGEVSLSQIYETIERIKKLSGSEIFEIFYDNGKVEWLIEGLEGEITIRYFELERLLMLEENKHNAIGFVIDKSYQVPEIRLDKNQFTKINDLIRSYKSKHVKEAQEN